MGSYEAEDANGTKQYFAADGTGAEGTPFTVQHEIVGAVGGSPVIVTAARAMSVDGSFSALPFNVSDGSNGTVTLVPGVTGQIIKLYKLLVSANTLDNFTFQFGGVTFWGPWYGGGVIDILPLIWTSGTGQGLTVIKGNSSTQATFAGFYTQG